MVVDKTISDEELLGVIRELSESTAKRDNAEGGINAATLSDNISLGPSQCQRRLRNLTEQNRLEVVHGYSSDTGVRKSYLPVDHPDLNRQGQAGGTNDEWVWIG